MNPERSNLGEMLVKKGLLTKEQLDTVHEYQKTLGGKIGGIIVKLGYMSDEALTREIAKHYSMEVTDLANMVLPVNLLKAVPRSVVEKHHLIPIHVTKNVLTVCMSDPTDYEALDELQFVTGKKIETTLATRESIRKAIAEFTGELESADMPADAPGSGAKLRPASRGSLQALREATESALVDDFRKRAADVTGGKRVNTQAITRAELRGALIPVLLKKGVITENDLYDGLIDVLRRKGVFEQRELQERARELGGQ
jgi:hypothetical protein